MRIWSSTHVHSGDFADAFIQSVLQPPLLSLTHRRWSQPRRATASSSAAVRGRRLAQGHLNTQLGGAGDRTSDLPVTSQPALPPVQLPSHLSYFTLFWNIFFYSIYFFLVYSIFSSDLVIKFISLLFFLLLTVCLISTCETLSKTFL